MEKLGPKDPQRIGGYRLLARLGAGGMGQVYLARSDRGRTVAVKLVRPELAAREEFRARFRQEVRNAQRVGGFWTAPVLDADTEAAVPWVATGYVAGPSLQQVVGHDHGPLPERSVRILAAGLAHALTNIHAAGIVHRDLKPSNVMVTIEGPRVIDFGVARALETVTDSGLTRTGAVIGSPGFMAPEQVRGEQITPASDVFCLGSVLAYAATGTLPFGGDEGGGVHAVLLRITEEEPDLAGVPEGIADLVRACLRKDPAARPSLAWILERTGAGDTVSDGHSREPWLPGALVAQLGRHAVRLLETEDPESAPEHGARYGGGTPGAVTPTLIAGPGRVPPQQPPAPAAVPHPAYGHAVRHPQPGYGHPQQPTGTPTPYNPYTGGAGGGSAYGTSVHATSPYGGPPSVGATPSYGGPHDPPYAPGPSHDEPEPPRRGGRTTALLVVIALVVALAAGGAVYAFRSGDGSSDTKAGPTPSRTAASQGSGSSGSEESSSPSPSPSASDGVIPAAYLGTWTTTIDNASGENTRRLTIEQGEVGDAVLSLVADGDTYHCEFTAELAGRPDGDGPLEIGPSTVTSGRPRSSCTPGAATEVTLLSDGRLQRVNNDTGEKLTYSRR
ncbi:protein kinase [Streptomyces sp. NPDC001388]|uniref:serine/threonine-protein kinase n=1 Tax=Streptomyces sp. NPDC001388 TaxID=3364568 RepID=UPI0036BE64BE